MTRNRQRWQVSKMRQETERQTEMKSERTSDNQKEGAMKEKMEWQPLKDRDRSEREGLNEVQNKWRQE